MSLGKLPDFRKVRVEASARQKFFRLFLILVCVVAFLWGIFSFMRWLAFEEPSRQELWSKITRGQALERSAAYSEWVLRLRATEDPLIEELRPNETELMWLVSQLRSLLEANDSSLDPNAAKIVAVLGYAPISAATEAILWSAFDKASQMGSENATILQIEALMSLARFHQPNNSESLARILKFSSADNSLKKALAFSLGAALERVVLEKGNIGYENSLRQHLYLLLEESSEEVRWNAILGLARVADPVAKPLLKRLLYEAEQTSANDPNFGILRFQLYKEAFSMAYRYEDTELRGMVEKISRDHPHLRLRQAAKIFVEK